MISGIKTYICRPSQPIAFIWDIYIKIQPFSDMKDVKKYTFIAYSKQVRGKGDIITFLFGDEINNVPNVTTPTLTILHYSGGHLRCGHPMDIGVTVWILPLCLGPL